MMLFSLILTALASEPITFFHGRDVYQDFATWLELAAGEKRELQGRDCRVVLERDERRVTLTIGRGLYTVSAKSDVNGGFTTSKLWSDFFKNDGRSRVPGQYGMRTSIRVEKDADGKLVKFHYTRGRHDDRMFKLLARVDCSL